MAKRSNGFTLNNKAGNEFKQSSALSANPSL